jgi:sugar phosphate isomerase/epimerase
VKFSSSPAETTAMKYLYFRSVWGMDDCPTLEAKFKKIKDGGFDGVELDVPLDMETCRRAGRSLDEIGLAVVASNGGPAAKRWRNTRPVLSSNTSGLWL